MKAARFPRERRAAQTLFIDEVSGQVEVGSPKDIGRWLRPGDLLVLNDAATMPASLAGHTEAGDPVEVRLAGRLEHTWWAALLGAGDWRTPTEQRPAPPSVQAGQRLLFGDGLSARVHRVSPPDGRRLELAFDQDEATFWAAIYTVGRPIQYGYQTDDLPLMAMQTPLAQRPVAVEMPSAAWALTSQAQKNLQRCGVEIAWLTHASGLSSIGDATHDRSLPWPERYAIPSKTIAAIERARAREGRVIAAGTSVVRALEASIDDWTSRDAVEGVTHLTLHPGYRRRVVDGLLTNVHEKGESHYELLRAFAKTETLERMNHAVQDLGFVNHEHGDTVLLVAPR
ncbi:MAG: S-adenosylmethionine:tRNA ribosyltransferase-isomerase [Myxococcota bacterium]